MLIQLTINDYIIVEHAEIHLSAGFTVLTGETGAGKSILVDALGLLLGDRGDPSAVRPGKERADLTAVFDIGHSPAVQQWLTECDLNLGDELILRRVIAREGRSRCYINGQPVTVQQTATLGDLLVDIHSQHEHQSLLRRDCQRSLVDGFAAAEELTQEVSNAHADWHLANQRLEAFRKAASDRENRIDYLRFQVEELEHLAPKTREMHDLDAEHRILAHAGDLIQLGQESLTTLSESEESAATHQLAKVISHLERMARMDERIQSCGQLVNEALIRAEEAANDLRHLLSELELDPARLAAVEERIGELRAAARKHKVEVDALPELLNGLRNELTSLEDVELQLNDLDKQLKQKEKHYCDCATSLSKARRRAAKKLATQVTKSMQLLGMQGGRFDIELELDETLFSEHGQDRITFLVGANPGQPLQPLAKAASGGELSRISLAIQVNSAAKTPVGTLIYDEVDVGIGGGIAEVVGRMLAELGAQRQVLSITHLPQVAAQGDHHIQVSKASNKNETQARLLILQGDERTEEIARMLGGVEITRQTRAHAEEMLGQRSGQ
jgi:DNA repair protein RecN (Recombination protein N)